MTLRPPPLTGFTHGYSAYTNSCCRCEACTEANRIWCKDYRARVAGSLQPDDPRHGTWNAYSNFACRCSSCKETGATRSRRQRLARTLKRTEVG